MKTANTVVANLILIGWFIPRSVRSSPPPDCGIQVAVAGHSPGFLLSAVGVPSIRVRDPPFLLPLPSPFPFFPVQRGFFFSSPQWYGTLV